MKELYFKRDIYGKMLEWKESQKLNRTALEVQGARQVGKTFIIEKFTNENYKKVYYINLFDSPDRAKAEHAFKFALSTLDTLKLFFPNFIDDTDSVVVIDEVQEYHYMYNLIRPMMRDLKVNLIVTGSFLGKTINRNYFVPGLELVRMELKSLSFPEFLDIFNHRPLFESIDLWGGGKHDDYELLKKSYQLYMSVGGYPSAIKRSLETGDIDKVHLDLRRIIDLFCEDSRKYFDKMDDANALSRLLREIATFLLYDNRIKLHFGRELVKLDYGKLSHKKTIQSCLSWLECSHLIGPCGKYTDLDKVSSDARYYFKDVGLANYLFNEAKTNSSNKIGRLAENFVYRCILDHEMFGDTMPYFATYGDNELDFFAFIKNGNDIKKIAVEVKNQRSSRGSASDLLKSGKLDYIVFAKGDTHGGRTDNIFTVPIYLFSRFNTEIIFGSTKRDNIKDLINAITNMNTF